MKLKLILLLLTGSLAAAAQVKPLKVGEQCPPQLAAFLKQLAGNQAVLLDFWGTWCLPCVAALPKMDSLQQRYSGRLKILCVTQGVDRLVPEVLRKTFGGRAASVTFIPQNALLKAAFPHGSLPNYVLIDSTGLVTAFPEEISNITIRKLLAGQSVKNKVPQTRVDHYRPLYATGQLRFRADSDAIYLSALTAYRPDLGTSHSRGGNFITSTNTALLKLFQLAYGRFDLQYLDMSRVLLQGFTTEEDSLRLGVKTSERLMARWPAVKAQWAFNYELKVPAGYTNEELFKLMQADLNRFGLPRGIRAHEEKMDRRVLALVTTGNGPVPFQANGLADGHYSTPGSVRMINQPMSFFLSQLLLFTEPGLPPLVNGTGYTGKVSLELDLPKHDLATLNRALAKYGLTLQERVEPTLMLVVEKLR